MRRVQVLGIGLVAALMVTGCSHAVSAPPAKTAANPDVPVATAQAAAQDDTGVTSTSSAVASDGDPRSASSATGAWIGAAAEGDLMMTGTRDTALGIWVDVPEVRQTSHPPMQVSLVIDTSGSMAGAKIENARKAATTLVNRLSDGDIVALDTFSDSARTVVAPTRLSPQSRQEILHAIAALSVSGSTNMFDGLTLAERQLAATPATHPLRRIVLVSDGIANVGPSSPETLGTIARNGLRFRAQVTSLGVGNDYDEHTLNALAVQSSGRLYHLTEPREMASILGRELDLLNATIASDSFVEVVPAPGVELIGADGIRADRHEGGSLRIPLGALHSGQHREALVRVRISDPSLFEGQTHPLASVRLRFRDARDSDLERVQEVVARTQLTGDGRAVAAHVSSRTKAIVAIQEAARLQVEAAQRINDGRFMDADDELARAQAQLAAQAAVVTGPAEKKRLAEAETQIATARATAAAAPAKPMAARRATALDMNAQGMKDMGY